jgi:hypothetical protein
MRGERISLPPPLLVTNVGLRLHDFVQNECHGGAPLLVLNS